MYSKAEDIDNIDNIEIITWAFEKGYNLGGTDMKEGIHINIAEIKKYFLQELTEFNTNTNKNKNKKCVGT